MAGAGEQFVPPAPQLAVLSGDADPHGGHHRHADEAVLGQAGVEVGAGQPGEREDDGSVTNHLLVNSLARAGRVVTRPGEVLRLPRQPVREVSEVPLIAGLQGLLDESPQPERNIADQEVTQTQSRHQLPPEEAHLVAEEHEVHLHEDEDDLETWSEDVENLPAGDEVVAVEADSEQPSHLDTDVDDAADAKH